MSYKKFINDTGETIIDEEMFNVFNKKENYKELIESRTVAILIKDILEVMYTYLQNKIAGKADEKDDNIFAGYKKILSMFKQIKRKSGKFEANPDFFKDYCYPSEQDFFVRNVKREITEKIAGSFKRNEAFYISHNTNIGTAMHDYIKKEKMKGLVNIFSDKQLDIGYAYAISSIDDNWTGRVQEFKKDCSNIKTFNRSVKNA